ncbi:hypothetical protein JCM19039_2998 [Geomicrobium sp. JCM 19039]|nr:hypothetical protein JCM19039_2998 [Geomicrobium sp. JCM 19039]
MDWNKNEAKTGIVGDFVSNPSSFGSKNGLTQARTEKIRKIYRSTPLSYPEAHKNSRP